MMSENNLPSHLLPPTWTMTTLGAVVAYGRTNKAEPSEMTGADWVLELEDIEKDSSRLLGRLTFADRQSKSTKNRFEAGDVLYGKLRPYLNKVFIADQPGFCTTEIVPIQVGEHLDARYLFYWLKHPAFLKYVEAESHGMNMPRLGTDAGRAAPLVLAPRAEQTRIADQLDTLLARVNACNNHLDAIPGILKRFRQAIFQAAAIGSLTNDPGKNGSEGMQTIQIGDEYFCVPSTWQVTELAQVIDPSRPLCYGVVQPGNEDADGVPLIRVQDMSEGTVLPVQLRTVSQEVDQEYRRSRVVGGEVLISVVGTIGRTAVVPVGLEANIARAVARVACRQGVIGHWVHYWLSTTSMQWLLLSSSKEVARKTLNLSDLARMPVAVPSLEEQQLIVDRVERLLAIADQIEKRCTAAKVNADRLAPQVLAKAFRGELVEQEPSDEPASALLKRLAATTSAKAPSSRGRPRAQPQVPATSPTPQAPAPVDWQTLPNNEWAAPVAAQDQAITVCLTAVLKAWGQPMPEQEARLAALLCQQPCVFTTVLPAAQAKEWLRLVGAEAEPLSAQVARLQPASNSPWGQAIKRMRARGDLIEASGGDDTTWSLGPGASAIITAGWPDGRAGFVVAYLRAHGVVSILPALAPADQAFVHVRAA